MSPSRIRIYRLLPRVFGNTRETRQLHGKLAQNGVGKFADINDTALAPLGGQTPAQVHGKKPATESTLFLKTAA